MLQFIYTILLYLIQPFVWLRLLLRSRKAPAYRKRWAERYGFCKGKVKPNGILVHSVSVGETIAAIPLIKALQTRYPNLPITVTTMTPTGSAQVIKSLGDSVSHVYLPYDLPCALKRFFNTLQPKLVIIMETELWPNIIHQLNQRHIPLIIANARLSERSAKRYAKLGKSIAHLLTQISYIAAQNETDKQRFIALGCPQTQISATGSIKFDIHLTQAQIEQIADLKAQWQLTRPVWIAASTHQGEDELMLQAHQQLLQYHPDFLLILVPRHPERFNDVAQLIKAHHFTLQKRSEQQALNPQTQVLLGDTMGELILLYGLANIAVVGGSFVDRGGHNPLEPALHHLPIIMGKHIFNFSVICEQLVQAQGLMLVESNCMKIFNKINDLQNNSKQCQQMGENAYQVLKRNQGALDRLLTIIDQHIIHQ